MAPGGSRTLSDSRAGCREDQSPWTHTVTPAAVIGGERTAGAGPSRGRWSSTCAWGCGPAGRRTHPHARRRRPGHGADEPQGGGGPGRGPGQPQGEPAGPVGVHVQLGLPPQGRAGRAGAGGGGAEEVQARAPVLPQERLQPEPHRPLLLGPRGLVAVRLPADLRREARPAGEGAEDHVREVHGRGPVRCRRAGGRSHHHEAVAHGRQEGVVAALLRRGHPAEDEGAGAGRCLRRGADHPPPDDGELAHTQAQQAGGGQGGRGGPCAQEELLDAVGAEEAGRVGEPAAVVRRVVEGHLHPLAAGDRLELRREAGGRAPDRGGGAAAAERGGVDQSAEHAAGGPGGGVGRGPAHPEARGVAGPRGGDQEAGGPLGVQGHLALPGGGRPGVGEGLPQREAVVGVHGQGPQVPAVVGAGWGPLLRQPAEEGLHQLRGRPVGAGPDDETTVAAEDDEVVGRRPLRLLPEGEGQADGLRSGERGPAALQPDLRWAIVGGLAEEHAVEGARAGRRGGGGGGLRALTVPHVCGGVVVVPPTARGA